MTDPKTLAESGILLVDKPEDWTSHDVVNLIRRRFRVKKVGHCGTLDPAATGLLVLVLGRATKLSNKLSSQDKTYSGTMRLGIETFTQDREGDVTATGDTSAVTPEQVHEVIDSFKGDQLQIPPMVSAKKKDGKPLYKLARKGQEVEREPRAIVVYSFDVTDISMPDVTFEVRCSKGTYVRTLCYDMGRTLGCGAHLHALRRLRSGSFSVEDAYTVDDIKTWDREKLLDTMTPLAEVLVSFV